MLRPVLLATLLPAWLGGAPDRRVVDRIAIGDSLSEREHACLKTATWTRCALATFDDTEVTIASTFAGTSAPRSFDLVVENRTVATYTFSSADSQTVELRVPLAITAGRTNILVTLRAHDGALPALIALRSEQDHNE